MLIDYDEWIDRERRIRLSILRESNPGQRKIYRICQECDEVCLCHEENCPNCNHANIKEQRIEDIESEARGRIRCRHRFDHLLR